MTEYFSQNLCKVSNLCKISLLMIPSNKTSWNCVSYVQLTNKNKKYTNAVSVCWNQQWQNSFNHMFIKNFLCFFVWKENCFCNIINKTLQWSFGKHQHFTAKKSYCWFYFTIFFNSYAGYTAGKCWSNSIIDFVLGHFSSYFYFSSMSLIVFFYAFFVLIFE